MLEKRVFSQNRHYQFVQWTFNLRNIFVCTEDKIASGETTITEGSSYEKSDRSLGFLLGQLPSNFRFCPRDKLSNLYPNMDFMLIFRIEEVS